MEEKKQAGLRENGKGTTDKVLNFIETFHRKD